MKDERSSCENESRRLSFYGKVSELRKRSVILSCCHQKRSRLEPTKHKFADISYGLFPLYRQIVPALLIYYTFLLFQFFPSFSSSSSLLLILQCTFVFTISFLLLLILLIHYLFSSSIFPPPLSSSASTIHFLKIFTLLHLLSPPLSIFLYPVPSPSSPSFSTSFF